MIKVRLQVERDNLKGDAVELTRKLEDENSLRNDLEDELQRLRKDVDDATMVRISFAPKILHFYIHFLTRKSLLFWHQKFYFFDTKNYSVFYTENIVFLHNFLYQNFLYQHFFILFTNFFFRQNICLLFLFFTPHFCFLYQIFVHQFVQNFNIKIHLNGPS